MYNVYTLPPTIASPGDAAAPAVAVEPHLDGLWGGAAVDAVGGRQDLVGGDEGPAAEAEAVSPPLHAHHHAVRVVGPEVAADDLAALAAGGAAEVAGAEAAGGGGHGGGGGRRRRRWWRRRRRRGRRRRAVTSSLREAVQAGATVAGADELKK